MVIVMEKHTAESNIERVMSDNGKGYKSEFAKAVTERPRR